MPTERGGYPAGHETPPRPDSTPCVAVAETSSSVGRSGDQVETFLVGLGEGCGFVGSLAGSRYRVANEAPSYQDLTLPCGSGRNLVLLIGSSALDEVEQFVFAARTQEMSNLRVVSVVDLLGAQELSRAFKPWVDGYVAADTPREALIAYLDLAMMGQRFMAGESLSTIMAAIRLIDRASSDAAGEAELAAQGITLHQLQVLMRVTEGLTDKEIAIALGISETTVRFHNRACWPKIGAKNRTQAAIWALKNLSLR